MSAAVEKLEELITESQAPEGSKLFPLDQSDTIVAIEIVDGDERLELSHRIKRRTLAALIERDQQLPHETEILGGGEARFQSADVTTANAKLWDQFASEAKGYTGEPGTAWDGINPEIWTSLTPVLAAEIPSEHKSEAINGLYDWKYEIERPKGKGFVLGAQTYKVKQTLGPYTIWHLFRKPNERARRDIARKASETRYQTGSPKLKSKVFTKLKVFVELYDTLFEGLEGVTGDSPNITQRKDLIDPLWKRAAVDCLMGGFEASRGD